MMPILTYIFYPNPGRVTYGSPEMLALLGLCAGLVVLSFVIKFWRSRLQNASTKKLSRSWSSLCLWFGVVGLVLVVARVEKIQFVAMRFLWVIWVGALLFALYVQFRIFRMKHYEVLPRVGKTDPRDQYLPGKKR